MVKKRQLWVRLSPLTQHAIGSFRSIASCQPCSTLAEHPRFNARFDTDKQEVIYHRHCNIGIATPTEAGLTVPVLRNADCRYWILHGLSTV
jgi:pyruvate/2-oxoglutarate dehydrogenase complex dihydrolipoamide acyltransferase (E2) component